MYSTVINHRAIDSQSTESVLVRLKVVSIIMEYSIKPKSLGERRIIHYPQKRIIGLYVIAMKIERIDDKTVKCFLSNEELEEYDIDYKDFVTRSDKAKEVVQEIIEQAEEEVGYKPPKYAFDLQIMMLPDEGLVLVFSEKEPLENKNGAQLLQALQEMKRVFEEKKAEIGATLGKQAKEETENNAGKNKKAKGKAEEAAKPQFAIFAFRNIGRVIEYAAILPANLRINSTLYRMEDGTCYVYVQKGGASYERYSRACIQAMEFAALYAADEQKIRYLEEHGECLIREKALKKLRA